MEAGTPKTEKSPNLVTKIMCHLRMREMPVMKLTIDASTVVQTVLKKLTATVSKIVTSSFQIVCLEQEIRLSGRKLFFFEH
jgi:hypothetical protein